MKASVPISAEVEESEVVARDRWRTGIHRNVDGECPVCTEYFEVSWLCLAAGAGDDADTD